MKQIVITEQSIVEWRAELARLDDDLRVLSQKRSNLQRKIELVPLLFDNGSAPPPDIPVTPAQVGADPGMGLTAAMRTALKVAKPGTYTRRSLRDEIVRVLGEKKLGTRFSMYYGTLNRLMLAEEVTEDRRGRLSYKEEEQGKEPSKS